jgi:hypothetical protein
MTEEGLRPDQSQVEAVEQLRQTLEFHPIANIFPLMEGEAFAQFCDDIRENGLRESIVLYEGKILDGRNRYRACERAGVAPWKELYKGDDPLGYVVSLNLQRRHLNESQRAMVAHRIEEMKHGGARTQDASLHLDRSKAAKLLNVSERSVATAAKVQREASPEIIAAVEKGEASVSAAATAVDAIADYPFMKNPHWSPTAIAQAKRALDKLDEGERPVVADLVERAAADVKLGVEIAKKVANSSIAERKQFFQMIESDDERERSKARTWAATREPMPDPRLMVYRKIVLEAKDTVKEFPNDPEVPVVNRGIALFEQAIDSIKSRSKEAANGRAVVD